MDATRPDDELTLDGRMLAGRYRLSGRQAIGAQTAIIDAHDVQMNRLVTVKIVRPALAEDPEFRRRFRAEAQAVASLSHPNLAALYDWGEDEFAGRESVYLVVEHLSGGSLRDLVDRGRLLSPSQALVVGLDACRGLDFAHRRGRIHGELTPSKLVFGDDRRLRIVDFALSRLLGEQAWRDPATVGASVARYASPEQALGQPIDAKTDVYALCLGLIEAVTGKVPFAAESTVATLSARVGRLMPVSADLGSLAAVLERAGRADPADRSSAAEFGRALVQAAEKLPRPAPIPIIAPTAFDDPLRHVAGDEALGEPERRPSAPDGEEADVTAPIVAPVVPPAAARQVDPMLPPRPPTLPPREAVPTAAPAVPAPVADTASAGPSAPDAMHAAPTAAAVDAGARRGSPVDGADDTSPVTMFDAGLDDDFAPASGRAGRRAARHAAKETAKVAEAIERAAAKQAAKSAKQATKSARRGRPVDATAAADGRTDVADVATATDDGRTDVADVATATDDVTVPIVARRRRRWPWVLLTVVLLGAAGAGGTYAVMKLTETKTHVVPPMAGLDESAARALVADYQWDIEIRRVRSDDEPEPGVVIGTEPDAGVEIAEGEPFLIIVSDGPEFRALPDLVGLTQEEALAALAELQLVGVVGEPQFDETAPLGQVLSWTVLEQPTLVGGDEVLPGTEVGITASAGPAPRVVPGVASLTVADATAALAAVQLTITELEPVFSDTIGAGVIITQDPPAGTEVARDSTVNVTVSKGPDVVVLPDLSGLSLSAVTQALQDAGFSIGEIIGLTEGTFAQAKIDGEVVQPGGTYPRGTQVDLAFL